MSGFCEFDTLLLLKEYVDSKQGVDFGIINGDLPVKVELFDVSFDTWESLYNWIATADDEIKNGKYIMSIENMISQEYFKQRFLNKYKEVYLVKRNVDCILTVVHLDEGVPISCKDYESYCKDMMNQINN
jgi:hypothetical protein